MNRENVNNGNENAYKNSGGLYAKVNMSLKTANIITAAILLVLAGAIWFLASHNGFTVSFDTDGGSRVESVKAFYAETLADPGTPYKEGCTFTGWYTDPGCTQSWDISSDTVCSSMTLYAGWRK